MSPDKGRQTRRRKAVKARSVSARRVTAVVLQEGMAGPGDYRIRLARPGESRVVDRLIRMAGIEAEAELLEAVDDGVCGDLARRVIGGEATIEAGLVSLLYPAGGPGPDLLRALKGFSTVLVATHGRHDQPVGICHTTPPGMTMRRIADAMADDPMDDQLKAQYALLLGVRRISAVAVEPDHRGAGLGRALVELATRMTVQLGAQVLYGHVRTAENLADWYRGAGFAVLAPGQGLSLTWLIHPSASVRPGPDEHLIVRMADPRTPVPVLDRATGR